MGLPGPGSNTSARPLRFTTFQLKRPLGCPAAFSLRIIDGSIEARIRWGRPTGLLGAAGEHVGSPLLYTSIWTAFDFVVFR